MFISQVNINVVFSHFHEYTIDDMKNVKATFKTGNGDTVCGSTAIFPIIKYDQAGNVQFLATAFGINKEGLLATAKHVPFINEKSIYRYLFAIHFLEGGQYICRQIRHIAWHPKADIAVMLMARMDHNITGKPLFNKVMTLSSEVPSNNSHISTFAYPNTKVINNDGIQTIETNTDWYHGEVSEYHPNGRDRVFLPGKCYRTTLGFPGGASGGPVADDKGRVFAINSTSMSIEGGFSDAYVSSIHDLLEIELPDENDVKFPLYKLVEQNRISLI